MYRERHTLSDMPTTHDRTRSAMVSLRLPVPLLNALRGRAEDSGGTLSDTVRQLLAAGLSEWTSTESETRALRAEVRALRREVREALGRRNSR